MSRRSGGLSYGLTAGGVLVLLALIWIAQDQMRPVGVGTSAPDFAFATLDGDTLSLDDFEGRTVLVNVWATWCGPCRMEMPSMQRLYDQTSRDDLEILAVSIDARLGEFDPAGRPGGDIRSFADSLGLTFPILLNPRGDIQRTYQTTGVPETFLIGPDGQIRRKVAGGTEWDSEGHLEQIQRLIQEARASDG